MPHLICNLIGKRICAHFVTVILFLALNSGTDTIAQCSPQPEKLYTPNRSQIEAQIQELDSFVRDMRGTIADMKTAQTEDDSNRFWGHVNSIRTIAGEVGKSICSSVSLVNDKLAKPCKTAQSAVELINDLTSCAKGEVTGCVGLGLRKTKQWKKREGKIDNKLKSLDSDGLRAPVYPLDHYDAERVRTEIEAGINKAQRVGGEIAKGANKAAKKDDVGTETAECVIGSILIGSKTGEEIRALRGSVVKAGETLQTELELESAYDDNSLRRSKLIQQLELKADSVSRKLSDLRADLAPIDWSAMGKPEPNMTPIKQDECDKNLDDELSRLTEGSYRKRKVAGEVTSETLPEESQRALSQMSRTKLGGALGSGATEANSSLLSGETAAAILGTLGQSIKEMDHEKQPQPRNMISPKQQCVPGFNCLEDLQRARERQAAENRHAAEVLQRQWKENEARLRERERAGKDSGPKGPSQTIPVKPCSGCGCGNGVGNATC